MPTPLMDRWPRLASREVLATPIFRLRADQRRAPGGTTHDFYVMESVDWVNVIPLCPDGRVVMVRQPRFGIERATLEVPGGMVDPGDASPAVAAARELLEETGYAPAAGAAGMEPLGHVHPNPAIMTNVTWSFVARDCRRVGDVHLDGTEDIAVDLVPLAEVPRLIAAGEVTHALVVCGFFHLFARDGWPR